MLDARRSDQNLATLIDRLGNRFGASRLYRAAPAESDIPERSVERIPPLASPRGTNWSRMLPRPNRLLSPPEPIETIALLPDHPPAAFVWRGVRHVVRRLDGPETVYGEWWRAEQETESVRDYFQVEDDAGSRFWLFRAGLSNAAPWFIHGLFG
jgi:protein ImuB